MKRKKSSPKRWFAVPAGLALAGVAIYALLAARPFRRLGSRAVRRYR